MIFQIIRYKKDDDKGLLRLPLVRPCGSYLRVGTSHLYGRLCLGIGWDQWDKSEMRSAKLQLTDNGSIMVCKEEAEAAIPVRFFLIYSWIQGGLTKCLWEI